MPLFAGRDALEASLRESGLQRYAAMVLGAARPTIAFTRHVATDADLAAATSKIWGEPDLPPGFEWPERPPLPDLVPDNLDAPPAVRYPYFADLPDILARQVAADAAKADAVRRPMPLAFVAQVNLSALASLPGFDPRLPDHGVLTLFNDPLDWKARHTRLFWFEDTYALERRPTPEPSRALALTVNDTPEHMRDLPIQSEVWTANSAISAPNHMSWSGGPSYVPSYPADDPLLEWLYEPSGALELESFDPEFQGGDFGDRLGGWPLVIQGNVEDEVVREHGVPGMVQRYGVTSLAHVMGYGGESYVMPAGPMRDFDGDGNISIMMPEDRLAARDFGAVYDIGQRS